MPRIDLAELKRAWRELKQACLQFCYAVKDASVILGLIFVGAFLLGRCSMVV